MEYNTGDYVIFQRVEGGKIIHEQGFLIKIAEPKFTDFYCVFRPANCDQREVANLRRQHIIKKIAKPKQCRFDDLVYGRRWT